MHIHKFSISLKGEAYSATWHEDDAHVFVTSAYGSGKAKAGIDPAAAAEKLLSKIVKQRRR